MDIKTNQHLDDVGVQFENVNWLLLEEEHSWKHRLSSSLNCRIEHENLVPLLRTPEMQC